MSDKKPLPRAVIVYPFDRVLPETYCDMIYQLFTDLKHICIDKDPVAELVLRLQLAKVNVKPEEVEVNIYGYTGQSPEGLTYIYVNHEQHKVLQDMLGASEACEVINGESNIEQSNS